MLNSQIKAVQQKLQRTIAAGIRTELCGFKALLDGQNKQILSAKGNPRRELVWLKAPSKSYLKARQLLSQLYDRRNTLRKDFRHRATTAIINLVLAQGKDLIEVEDLQITNMTASAKGSKEHPNHRVRAKAGLNRSILQQGWGEILDHARIQSPQSRHPPSSPSGPAHSSQTCSQCGVVDPKSRKSQAQFLCTSCGHEDNADVNASRVIAHSEASSNSRERQKAFA